MILLSLVLVLGVGFFFCFLAAFILYAVLAAMGGTTHGGNWSAGNNEKKKRNPTGATIGKFAMSTWVFSTTLALCCVFMLPLETYFARLSDEHTFDENEGMHDDDVKSNRIHTVHTVFSTILGVFAFNTSVGLPAAYYYCVHQNGTSRKLKWDTLKSMISFLLLYILAAESVAFITDCVSGGDIVDMKKKTNAVVESLMHFKIGTTIGSGTGTTTAVRYPSSAELLTNSIGFFIIVGVFLFAIVTAYGMVMVPYVIITSPLGGGEKKRRETLHRGGRTSYCRERFHMVGVCSERGWAVGKVRGIGQRGRKIGRRLVPRAAFTFFPLPHLWQQFETVPKNITMILRKI